MIDGKYHERRIYHGRPILIDLARFDGAYEAIVMDSRTSDDLECFRSSDLGEAIAAFRGMLKKYPSSPAPLKGRYAKLRDDLRKALAAGKAAETENPEDGGTCNFDSASISLPRWRSSLVEQAAAEAGTGCFTWSLFGGSRFVFSPDTRSQGNARSRNAEAMTEALRSMGYDAMDYSQMD